MGVGAASGLHGYVIFPPTTPNMTSIRGSLTNDGGKAAERTNHVLKMARTQIRVTLVKLKSEEYLSHKQKQWLFIDAEIYVPI